MGTLVKPYVFVDGKTPAGLITAQRLNDDFDTLYTGFNGNIEDVNIKAGAKILCSDRDYLGANKITGDFEFDAFPTVPDASVPDAKLSANVPLKDALNSFSVKQTFAAKIDMSKTEIEQPVIHKLAAAPGTPATGQIYFNTADSKFYGWTGSAWVDLGYVGGYTGGSIRSYTANGITDENSSLTIWFKTEGVAPTVKLALHGLIYPPRFYTELGYHDHAFVGTNHLHTLTDAGHVHNVVIGDHDHGATQFALSTHTHGASWGTDDEGAWHTHAVAGNSDNESGHVHGGVTIGGDSTDAAAGHLHAISFSSGNQSAKHSHNVSGSTGTPSASQSIASSGYGTKTSANAVTGLAVQNTAAAGTVQGKGVNAGALSTVQKIYADTLTVTIDGTNVTANILAATGWAKIGDGTGAHLFHNGGTGEMDASAWKAYAPGYHALEIVEPIATRGCTILAHIETT